MYSGKNRTTLRKENPGVCQICLNKGHWSYECTKKRAYLYRPSAMTKYKNKAEVDSPERNVSSKKMKKMPKYRVGKFDRRRFGEMESSSSSEDSDSNESGEEEGEGEGEEIEEENQEQVFGEIIEGNEAGKLDLFVMCGIGGN